MRAVSPPQRGWGFREGVGKRSTSFDEHGARDHAARERSGKRGAAVAEHEREGNHPFWSGGCLLPTRSDKRRSERAQWGGVYRRSAATEVVYRPRARRPRAPHQHGHAARCPRFGHRHGALICAICPRVSPRKSAVKERVGDLSVSDPSKYADFIRCDDTRHPPAPPTATRPRGCQPYIARPAHRRLWYPPASSAHVCYATHRHMTLGGDRL